MCRTDLLELLRAAPRGIADIALPPEAEPKDVEDDLHHVQRSLKHTGDRLVITPVRCRHRGLAFHKDKLGKPGGHPQCRETRIRPPRVHSEGTEDP